MSGIFGRTTIYSLGIFAPRFVGFALLPFYTRYLGPADYGAIAALDMIGVYFGLIVNSGFSSAMLRYYYQENNLKWQNKTFSTTISVTLAMGLVGVGVTAPLATYLSVIIFDSDQYEMCLVLILVTVAIEVSNSIVLTLLRVKENAKIFLVIALVRLGVAVPINIYLIGFLQIGVLGFVLSGLITAILIFLTFGCYYIYWNWHFPDLILAREIMGFSLPFIPTGFIEAFLNNLGILTLTMTGNLGAAGVFAVGQKLASIITIAFTPIGTVWTPLMYKLYGREDAQIIYAQVVTLIFFLLSCPVVFLGTFANEIVRLMTTENYSEAAFVIFPLAVGYLFFILRPTVRVGLTIAKKTIYIPILAAIPTALGFPMALFVANHFGAVGVACIIASIMSCTLVLTGWVSSKHVRIPFETSRLLRIGTLLSICYVTGSLLPQGWFLEKSLVVLSFPLLVYWYGGITPAEKKMATEFLYKKKLVYYS